MALFRSSCVLCGDSVARPISLCKPCESDLPLIRHACRQCGIPLNDNGNTTKVSVCGQCVQQPPAVDYTLSLYHYETPLDYMISQMKFQQQLSYAAILGELFKNRILEVTPELDLPNALLPIPLHKKRLIKRGFNQSIEISRAIAKEKQLPVLLKTIKRSKDTLAQTKLSKKDRQKNVKGCFELLSAPIHSHIVIIDDVVTTGATTNELAKTLKDAGVKRVGVWSIARADINQAR